MKNCTNAWQHDTSFLCDLGPAGTGVPATLVEDLSFEPHDFVLLDAAGRRTREFRAQVYSVEEELGVTAFRVVGSEFQQLIVRTYHGSTYRVAREQTVVFGGLRDVTDARTLEFLDRAVAEVRKQHDEDAARARREGEARVAAIPGSTDDPGLGGEYLRAQDLLRQRVRSYGMSRDEVLLEALGRFGAAPRTPSLLAAVPHFVEGCRHAAFDAGVTSRPFPIVAEPSRQPSELIGLLEALHLRLLDDAQVQEDADARQNAAAFRRAAECIDRARRCLTG